MGSSFHHIISNRNNRKLQRSAGGSFKLRASENKKPSAVTRTPQGAEDNVDFSARATAKGKEQLILYTLFVLLILAALVYYMW